MRAEEAAETCTSSSPVTGHKTGNAFLAIHLSLNTPKAAPEIIKILTRVPECTFFRQLDTQPGATIIFP